MQEAYEQEIADLRAKLVAARQTSKHFAGVADKHEQHIEEQRKYATRLRQALEAAKVAIEELLLQPPYDDETHRAVKDWQEKYNALKGGE